MFKILLLLPGLLFALDSTVVPNSFLPNTLIESADFNENSDSIQRWSARLIDSLDAKFVRFTDLGGGDSTLDTLKVNFIRSNPNIDSITNPLLYLTGGMYMDSIRGNPDIDSLGGNIIMDTIGSVDSINVVNGISTPIVYSTSGIVRDASAAYGLVYSTSVLGLRFGAADSLILEYDGSGDYTLYSRDSKAFYINSRANLNLIGGSSGGGRVLVSSQDANAADSVMKVTGRIVADSVLVHGDVIADSLKGAIDFSGSISGDTITAVKVKTDTIQPSGGILSIGTAAAVTQIKAGGAEHEIDFGAGAVYQVVAEKNLILDANGDAAVTIDSFNNTSFGDFDIKIGDTTYMDVGDAIYFGPPSTDGTFRMFETGDSLTVQIRVGGSYTAAAFNSTSGKWGAP